MIDIEELTSENLKSDKIFNQVKDLVDHCIEYADYPEARDLLEKFWELMKNSKSSEFNKYDELVLQLKILVFHTLTDNEVATIFNTSIITALELGVDIADNLKSLFLLRMDDLNDYLLHGRLAQSLYTNNELLGKFKIQLKEQTNLSPQTLGNWLKNFSSSYKEDKVPTYLEEAEYLNNNKNVKRLDNHEKELLKNILRIYNYLRYPLRDTGDVKETGHNVMDKKIGSIDNLETTSGASDPMVRLKEKYNNYRRARWDVLKIEDELLVKTKGDITSIKRELASAAREYNKNTLIACVKMLARQGYLLEAIIESPAWITALGEYIITKYAAKSEPDEISRVVSELKQNYQNPAIVSEFLQYLFSDKLKIGQNESALTAIEVSQLLGGEYEKIAYGNQETGNFEYARNNVVDGKLVREE